MLNDISVVMEIEDYALETLITDLERLNLPLKRNEDPSLNEDGLIVYSGFINDEELNQLLTLRDISPYGSGYEIEKWNTGNSEIL